MADAGVIRLYDPVPVSGHYTGRWTLAVESWTPDPASDGGCAEFDVIVQLPGFFFGFVVSNDDALADLTLGFTFDSDAPPAWETSHGSLRVPPYSWTGSTTNAQQWDGVYAGPFDLGWAVTVDPLSHPSWLMSANPSVFATLCEPDFTPIGILYAASDVQTFDAPNDVGSGLLRVHIDDPDIADLTSGNIVVVSYLGTPFFAWRIEPWTQDTVSKDEAAGKLRTLSGRGTLATWEAAIVFGPLGASADLVGDYRPFGWADPNYDDTGWSSAVQIKQQSSGATPWAGAPTDWPAIGNTAYWIWSRAAVAGPPPQPVGISYFRKSFTLAGEMAIALFFSADDGFDLYLDGVRVAGETRAFQWAETKRFDIHLSAGTHYLAVRAENITRTAAATNVAGFVLAGIETDEGGATLSTLVVKTDNTWKASDYPAAPPGATPGYIIRKLLAEVQARDSGPQPSPLAAMTTSFSDTTDSNSSPWETLDASYRIGATYLEVIRQLCETHIDVQMDPASLTLHAYGKPAGVDYSSTIDLVEGENILTLTHESAPAAVTAALVRYGDGRYRVTSTAGAQWLEAYIEAGGAESPDQADRVASAVFDRRAADRVTPDALVEPTAGRTPYVDFANFDVITVPTHNGSTTTKKVYGITMTTDDEGDPFFHLEYET